MEVAKPRPKKKISKKRKSALRKYVQVKEVDEYFQDKRIEERLGNFANEEDIENLFTTNDNEIKEIAPKKLKRDKDVVFKSHFPPSLDDHIKPIRNPNANKAKAPTPKLKVTCRIKVPVDIQEEEGNKIDVKTARPNAFDVWGSSNPIPDVSNDIDIHGKRICKMIRVKPPSHIGKKPSEIPAIPAPMPGTSYNPSSEDHKELLTKAYEVEAMKLKKEAKIINATDKMFPSRSEAPNEATWLKEMSQGLPVPGADQEKDEGEEKADGERGDDSEDLRAYGNCPVRRENKKTEKDRRKMKELRLQQKKLKMEKENKLKEAQKFKINAAKKLLRQEEMRLAVRRAWRMHDAEQKKNVPKKLGRTRFREPDIDLKLSNELPDSLRSLRPEGHIMRDLLSSIQRRSMAPATAKGERGKKPRKYKPKVFERNSHRAIAA